MSKLNDPQKALEVGSGTGIWAKEMAEEFSQCEINCIDISPAPSLVKFPNNVKFKTMNVIEGIKCEDNTFDYAHMRLLCAAMPEDSWPIVIKDLARVCKSGGSIELVETDAKLVNAGPFGQEIDRWYDAVCRSRGIDLNKTRQIPQMMQEAGLQVETEHYIEFPLGEWYDQVGHQGWHDVFSLIHSLSAKIIAVNNVTQERIDYVLGKLHEENVANRVYWRMGVYVGRKP
ncbi:S-adenosyl-L-methionine-dependent methyltransferase [Syncephalis fuscata]|nr:S-adenosyl-L-methionine-dependent methyltransferase [Syncephalis fuscata]